MEIQTAYLASIFAIELVGRPVWMGPLVIEYARIDNNIIDGRDFLLLQRVNNILVDYVRVFAVFGISIEVPE